MYQALRPCRSERVRIRTLDYHVRAWGSPQPGSAPLVLLHGWMDVGASWQFVVDAFGAAFAAGRLIVAPDWRGFGASRLATPCDSHHFVDYLGDLDQLLDHYAGAQAVDLVGHSMGGNVAMMYAGARPARVRRLVNLEGFGLPASQSTQAGPRLARWMDEIRQWERGEMALKPYDSADGVALRLMKTNPRLASDKACWLARHWASQDAQGRWHIQGDAAHKIVNPLLYRVDEALALYAAITAPVLSVHAGDDSLARWWQGRYSLQEYQQRLAHVRDARTAVVPDAGHMLHHDQPQAVARLVENFLAGDAPA
ncbi:MAG: alpha/beta hydrolase [Proteobacteria bacterium]|nr:alpha/beta hydrolase [Pseudomonadota bacterium]